MEEMGHATAHRPRSPPPYPLIPPAQPPSWQTLTQEQRETILGAFGRLLADRLPPAFVVKKGVADERQ
jgi:hypothetical protein